MRWSHAAPLYSPVERSHSRGRGKNAYIHGARIPLDGARIAVFDTARDSCEQIDIPDAQTRAFRDDKGTIHLIASHYVTRASLGPTLESAKHNCEVVHKSAHDGRVENFDDATWLDSFYSIDGRRIVVSRIGKGDRVTGYWTPGKGAPVLVVHPGGSSSALRTESVGKLVQYGRPVLIV